MAKNKSSKFDISDGFFEDESDSATISEGKVSEEAKVKEQTETVNEDKPKVVYHPEAVEEIQVMEPKPVQQSQTTEAEKVSKKKDPEGKSIFSAISEEALEKMFQEYNEKKAKKPLELNETRGRKGLKLPRINMCFSELNYEYIKFESRRRGMSATEFVGFIIEQYRKSPEGHID